MSAPTVEALERRALTFCLAARLTSWPDPGLDGDARVLADALRDDADPLERAVADVGANASGAALEPEYIALFENGKDRCPIHETEYGRMRGLAKGNELADLEGFYTAFGMARADGAQAAVLGDHLAVELEFYGTLLARQAAALERHDLEGTSIVEAARRSFLGDHLGRVASVIAQQPPVASHPQYGPILGATSALVADECRRLAVAPAPLDLFAKEAEGEEVCCGATVSPKPAE